MMPPPKLARLPLIVEFRIVSWPFLEKIAPPPPEMQQLFGALATQPAAIDDFVIARSDGSALYNLAVAVDDRDMEITHVVRGEDHLSNTPRQILILQALGEEPPVYAHLPLLHGPDGKKLSKRHGAVSVEEFRADGYVAPALMNYLALLGWSYDDRTTIMSRDELVERFTLDRVGSSPATFDYEKLTWMNGLYLRELPPDVYADELVALLGGPALYLFGKRHSLGFDRFAVRFHVTNQPNADADESAGERGAAEQAAAEAGGDPGADNAAHRRRPGRRPVAWTGCRRRRRCAAGRRRRTGSRCSRRW